MRVHRTPSRKNLDFPGRPNRRITWVECHRPGHPGLWDYHVTKGWRKSHGAHLRTVLPTTDTTQPMEINCE